MLIQNDAKGDFCLLGKSQGRMAQSNFYSALAGFVDQGESLEEAVRREVKEEAGISVGQVSYHSSQPWPFPSSLMIGCHGIALNQEIVIDTEEMADVDAKKNQLLLVGSAATLAICFLGFAFIN